MGCIIGFRVCLTCLNIQNYSLPEYFKKCDAVEFMLAHKKLSTNMNLFSLCSLTYISLNKFVENIQINYKRPTL